MKTTIRRPSKTRTCHDDNCTVHVYPRRRGDHGAGELVIPTPGDVQALVVRRWDDNGRREAYMVLFDASGCSAAQPLPSRPRKAHAAAVQRARLWRRTGVMSR